MKPVPVIKDIIQDCTARGDVILDPSARSGTTLIAAEETGRCARLIEPSSIWCDGILQAYEELTGTPATLAGSSETYQEVAEQRAKAMAQGGRHGKTG